MDEIERKPFADLERFRKTAKTTRQLAWDLLKETRNPAYVSLRYGVPVDALEKALDKIPESEPRRDPSPAAAGIRSQLRHASTLLDPIAKSREPGEDDE